jgi:photosystem II stability/assembly factor-like uncharacterized protein
MRGRRCQCRRISPLDGSRRTLDAGRPALPIRDDPPTIQVEGSLRTLMKQEFAIRGGCAPRSGVGRGRASRAARYGGLPLLLVAGCVIPLDQGTLQDSGSTMVNGDASASDASASDASAIKGSWKNVTANLAGLPSSCGNLSYLSAKPDEDMLIAGVVGYGLYVSRNGGESWQVLTWEADASAPSDASMPTDADAGAQMINGRPSSIVYDPQVSNRYWVSAIYGGPGDMYVTTDDGASFTSLGSVYDNDLVSVDFTDSQRKTLLAGGHEQVQTVYRTADGGGTWTNVGSGLPDSGYCTSPLVIDAQTYLVGCNEAGGVYRTTDGGGTWTRMTTLAGSGPPLVASDGSIYWADPNGGGIARSTDQGVTWANVVAIPGAAGSVPPIELPDGRLASIGGPNGYPQTVVVSADNGAHWTSVSVELPYQDELGLVYSSQQKAFYIWHLTCGDGNVPVPKDAILSFAFNYMAE